MVDFYIWIKTPKHSIKKYKYFLGLKLGYELNV